MGRLHTCPASGCHRGTYTSLGPEESGPTAHHQAPIPAAQRVSLLGLTVVAWGPGLCLSRVSMALPVSWTQGLQALLPGVWSRADPEGLRPAHLTQSPAVLPGR